MRGNIITLHMTYGRVAQAGSLWQYDYGQRLVLYGIDLPSAYEVHFSNQENGQSKTMIGDSTGVDIPDEYLTSGDNIHVWLYLHNGENDGETEYHGIINVKKRSQPTNEEPTPVQQDVITQTIAALNDAVSEAESIAESIPQTIDDALTEAKESGEFDGEKGDPGEPGEDGYSPTVSVVDITGGHRITITDKTGTRTVDVMDGEKGDPGDPGDPGNPGQDGVSPTVTVTNITGGHRVTVTDKNGSRYFDVMDGAKGDKGDPGEDADPAELIDDNIQPSDPKYNKKTFSAQKIDGIVSDLNSAINVLTVEETLLRSDLPGTTVTVTFDSNDNPVSIVHSANGTTVRTDAFVWGTDTVTETRTASDKYITITTDLITLAQTVSEIQEVA